MSSTEDRFSVEVEDLEGSRAVELAAEALAGAVIYPASSARRKAKASGPADSGGFSVEGAAWELNQLLNQISALSERSSLSESDWGSLRRLVAHAVRQVSEQEDADAQLRRIALTDELTGLYNRRGFLVLAMHQLKLCRRNSQRAMLFFADVDGLKKANDLFGHAKGDELLVRCSGVLRATFRESDIIARLDGDEFAIFASEQQGQSQESILARLKKQVAEQNAVAGLYPLSISVGASRFDPLLPSSLAELLMAADRAMYQEKRSRPEFRSYAGLTGRVGLSRSENSAS